MIKTSSVSLSYFTPTRLPKKETRKPPQLPESPWVRVAPKRARSEPKDFILLIIFMATVCFLVLRKHTCNYAYWKLYIFTILEKIKENIAQITLEQKKMCINSTVHTNGHLVA